MCAEDLKFDHRMPEWLHIGLVNHIQRAMRTPDDCHGNPITVAFLRSHHFDVGEGVGWLREHGAHCDCEVVFNTRPEEPVPH
jgi:hypothetical protein